MRTHMQALLVAGLIIASIPGVAQTSGAPSTQPATNPQTNQKDPNDPSKGQDLVNPANAKDTTPAAVGQNKSTGNNMMQPKAMSMTARPDFKMLDTKNHGYVMASEVTNPWLKENFSKCDTDGDGKVTQSEYGICAKQ
jgi:hypothetical protein